MIFKGLLAASWLDKATDLRYIIRTNFSCQLHKTVLKWKSRKIPRVLWIDSNSCVRNSNFAPCSYQRYQSRRLKLDIRLGIGINSKIRQSSSCCSLWRIFFGVFMHSCDTCRDQVRFANYMPNEKTLQKTLLSQSDNLFRKTHAILT